MNIYDVVLFGLLLKEEKYGRIKQTWSSDCHRNESEEKVCFEVLLIAGSILIYLLMHNNALVLCAINTFGSDSGFYANLDAMLRLFSKYQDL
jgi:hypothetical protein